MPYNIETANPDCDGFAVVDEGGAVVGCHTSRGKALAHQRALYINVPDAKKGDPGVSDVHVDTIMKPSRRKKPAILKSANVDKLNTYHETLHKQSNTPSEAQLYVHHLIVEKIESKGAECNCSCGAWSAPVKVNEFTVNVEEISKSENPVLEPLRVVLTDALEKGVEVAQIIATLDMGGYVLKVKADNTKTPDTFVPPQGVRDEAKRALAWIADGKAGENFTAVGRARAVQLAQGEGVSRKTLARMRSFLARHAVDRQAEGYRPGEAGFPSPGRVAYAAWGGDAAKKWVEGLYRQHDLEKSYGDVETVYKADEKRFTLGPWYIPNQQDAHGEWTDQEELQKALWDYVKGGDRKIRLQHNKDVVAGQWLEVMTWPFSVDVGVNKADGNQEPRSFPAGTVFMGVQWEPWAWELVKKGKLTGYSIGGKAERMLVDLPEDENE